MTSINDLFIITLKLKNITHKQKGNNMNLFELKAVIKSLGFEVKGNKKQGYTIANEEFTTVVETLNDEVIEMLKSFLNTEVDTKSKTASHHLNDLLDICLDYEVINSEAQRFLLCDLVTNNTIESRTVLLQQIAVSFEDLVINKLEDLDLPGEFMFEYDNVLNTFNLNASLILSDNIDYENNITYYAQSSTEIDSSESMSKLLSKINDLLDFLS